MLLIPQGHFSTHLHVRITLVYLPIVSWKFNDDMGLKVLV